MLPTLLTSNLRPAELASALGERVASRLAEMTQRVALKGTDRRYAA
jgi:DNA replication protein DnaC